VRDYAVQVTEKPNDIRDAIFADLCRHFSEEQIVELTVRTALCGFFNRVNDSMQIGIEDGVVEDMVAHGVSEETLPKAVK
jgi:alkylhydroperoxidase family enzyme